MHFGETIMLAMPVSGFVPASRLLRFCASTALAGCIAFPALAQTATATKEDEDTEEVMVVTGSRVVVDNAKAPTPVTVATVEQLQLAAPRTITEGLLQLPIFAGSVSVANQSTGTTGSNGAANLNLRGLGTSRTLVLLGLVLGCRRRRAAPRSPDQPGRSRHRRCVGGLWFGCGRRRRQLPPEH